MEIVLFNDNYPGWRDSTTGTYRDIPSGIQSFRSIRNTINVISSPWKHIMLFFDNGYTILVMQDEEWIYQKINLIGDGLGIIRHVHSFGNGDEPQGTLDFYQNKVGQRINEGVPWINKASVYYIPESLNLPLYRGIDGRYYGVSSGVHYLDSREVSGTSFRGKIPLNIEGTPFLIRSESEQEIVAVQILAFNRVGDKVRTINVTPQEPDIIHHYYILGKPLSLVPENDFIPVENYPPVPIAAERLEQMENEGIPIQDYPPGLYHLYFVEGDSMPYYNESNDREFRRVSDDSRVAELPPGIVYGMNLTADQMTREAVLLMEDRGTEIYTALISIDVDEVPIDFNEIEYSGSLGVQIRIYSLFHQGYLFEIINRAIRNGATRINFAVLVQTYQEGSQARVEQRSSVQPSSLINQSHERLIAWIYNIPVPLPDILGDYQKSSLEQINQLLQSGQIARFEMNLMLQPWAGPPGTLNRVLTFQSIDGQKLFVVAQYNPRTNQILPPQSVS